MNNFVVVDACILLKWVFNSPDEGDRNKALKILDLWIAGDIEIILPKLWIFEVSNVLGIKQPDIAKDVMDIFMNYGFTEVEISKELLERAFPIVSIYKVTFYDAIYHALAIVKEGIFITADKKYFNKVNDNKYVKYLGDLT